MKDMLRRLAYGSLVQRELADNHRPLSDAGRSLLVRGLRTHYFAQPLNYFAATPDAYLASAEGQKDLDDHVDGRLKWDRERVIPWLDSAMPLAGKRVLEIGCGTGASTVALAEQRAIVTALDVNQDNLAAARMRVQLYGLQAKFVTANATQIAELFQPGAFDFIIFFATLEHLTHAERLQAMRSTWAMLKPGQMWAVVETPNRLWPYDDHTACLPFYHWLPDDLALEYAPYSDRPFMKAYAQSPRDDVTRLDLARRGRGVSFHEFDLTMGDIDVVSAMNPYLRSKNLAIRAKWLASKEPAVSRMLRSMGPARHEGFYQPYLDLIVRKG